MSHSSSLLFGKTAIVTGATSGIGKAIALCFLREGATVWGIGTSAEKGKLLVEEAHQINAADRLTFHQTDLSSPKAIEELFSAYFSQNKALDILVNNAGITRDGLLMRMSLEDFEKVIDTNLRSCFLTCQAASKTMMKARSGKIVNISSVVGLSGNPGQTNYAASKAGMIGLTKSLAKEIGSRNVLVNCIAPGFIDTSMTQHLDPQKKGFALEQIPLGRIGTPEEIAQAVLFLASPMNTYITGQTLIVDGGMTM